MTNAENDREWYCIDCSEHKQYYFSERKFVTLFQQIKNNYLVREQGRIWYVLGVILDSKL